MQKKKLLFHQDNALCHKSMKTMVKLNELRFELLSHAPYSPDLAPSDYWLFADLKNMHQGKRFGSNEEVIGETEAYFESKYNPIEKSYVGYHIGSHIGSFVGSYIGSCVRSYVRSYVGIWHKKSHKILHKILYKILCILK